MHRRNMLAATLAGAGGMLAALSGTRSAKAAAPDKAKAVYHLSDLDKVAFVIGNIRNHYEGMGGPDKVTIALVVHGPALKAFQTASAGPDLARHVGEFHRQGLELNACGNTMRAQKITLNDLLPGFINADQGGVVRIAELQGQGYAYLRP
jgi:intracellular sulfur oxidation DsrE/DsrF family protein